MAHDFAHRSARPQRSQSQSAAGSRFHLTSFASGALVGAVLAIAVFLAPHWWPIDALEATVAIGQSNGKAESVAAGPKYVFYDELLRSQVKTNTAPYNGPAAADPDPHESSSPERVTEPPGEFVLQAGSFRTHDDADRLRESLEGIGFASVTTAVTLGDGSQRHRVLVGPFATELDVHRALTQLRERNIDALLLRR